MVKNQEIADAKWDILIVLDACRFDVFKELYPSYFEGNLSKRKSRGSHTTEWAVNTFTDKYPFTYISSNPYINGKNVPIEKYNFNWTSTKHFKKVIDAWDTDWDSKYNTVLPKDLVKIAKKHLSEKKLVLHFIQPHTPYINEDFIKNSKYSSHTGAEEAVGRKNPKIKIPSFIKPALRPLWKKFPMTLQIKVQYLFGFGKLNILKKAYCNGDLLEMRNHYKKSLEITLKEIANFIKEVPKDKKIVITADHGECFGEDSLISHPPFSKNPILRNVPWFETKGKSK